MKKKEKKKKKSDWRMKVLHQSDAYRKDEKTSQYDKR